MSITFFTVIGMLVLSVAAPFIALYAVSRIKKRDYKTHERIQKWLFWACIIAVVILEVRIRLSGGSGSLVPNHGYTDTTFFKYLLGAHIIGAVLTYIIWAVSIYVSIKVRKMGEALPGKFSATHRKLGYVTIIGLFYTAITATIVCALAFFL